MSIFRKARTLVRAFMLLPALLFSLLKPPHTDTLASDQIF